MASRTRTFAPASVSEAPTVSISVRKRAVAGSTIGLTSVMRPVTGGAPASLEAIRRTRSPA
ncbi:MAG TPA: hypothetical protein VNN15_04270 [Solirubrobacterales bacterium]|nr:hypothetical protein [Solirubrobacterales bacterium]